MKKLFSILLCAVIIFTLGLPVCAQDETVAVEEQENIPAESELTTEEAPAVTQSTENYDEYARQLAGYIFSGSESSAELMDKIIAIGNQYQESKEAGYTFSERIKQLLTPENIITTVAAGFLLVCGIAFFVIEQRRKNDRFRIYSYVSELESKYCDEVESNKKLRAEVEAETKEISEMKKLLIELSGKSTVTKKEMEHVSHTATAVCDMVKDVFLNSKTLSADAKELMMHNYNKAFESEKSDKENENEQQDEI